MGSGQSTPVGGISPTFAIGTLVRVVPSNLEDGHRAKGTDWDDDKEAKIGCVGIVCGGKEAADDCADVCFSYDGEKFDFERFQSEWLEAADDVDAEEQKKFQRILFKAVCVHARQKMGQSKKDQCTSAFGPVGTFVKVIGEKPSEKTLHNITWDEQQDVTKGQIGVASVGVHGNITLVSFGSPVHYTMCFPDAWLEPFDVESLPKESEAQKLELLALRDAIVAEKTGEDTAKIIAKLEQLEQNLASYQETVVSRLESIETALQSP